MTEESLNIDDAENVVRLISSEWIEDGCLLNAAFALTPKEKYLSVLRPIIETFNEDILLLTTKHEEFKSDDSHCQTALLKVGAIRNIKIDNGNEILNRAKNGNVDMSKILAYLKDVANRQLE